MCYTSSFYYTFQYLYLVYFVFYFGKSIYIFIIIYILIYSRHVQILKHLGATKNGPSRGSAWL